VSAPRPVMSLDSAVFAAWCDEIESGRASYAQLKAWRARLGTNEFQCGPESELMALKIADGLARMLDCEARDLPDPPGLGNPWPAA
jgi:hypothetical protein